VSRVGGNAQVAPMRKVAGRLKIELSQYRDLEAFAQFGSDLDPDTQRTLARGERIVKTLNQGERQPMAIEDQVAVIYAATSGFLDRIDAAKVPDFDEKLVERLHASAADTLKKIGEGDWSDETQKALNEATKEFAEDYGYDLDEEGHPLDEGGGGDDEERSERREREARSEDESDDDGDEGSDQEEREGEAVGAGS
jgi:F-type H+-transporting ATPase subunit alpha